MIASIWSVFHLSRREGVRATWRFSPVASPPTQTTTHPFLPLSQVLFSSIGVQGVEGSARTGLPGRGASRLHRPERGHFRARSPAEPALAPQEEAGGGRARHRQRHQRGECTHWHSHAPVCVEECKSMIQELCFLSLTNVFTSPTHKYGFFIYYLKCDTLMRYGVLYLGPAIGECLATVILFFFYFKVKQRRVRPKSSLRATQRHLFRSLCPRWFVCWL
jgi:hypothetical protein